MIKKESKSKKSIRTALISLIERRFFSDINVTDIAAEADVARATFYLHFNSKEEVLLDYIDDMFNLFFEQIEETLEHTDQLSEDIVEKMFLSFYQEPKFSQILLQEELHSILLGRFKGYLSRIVGRVSQQDTRFAIPNEQLSFLIDYWAAGSFHLIVRWVKDEFKPSCQTMAGLYARLTLSGMKAMLD